MTQLILERRERLRIRMAPQAAEAMARPDVMAIAEIRHFPVVEPGSGNRYSLLKITTRSGLIGWGECGHDPNADLKALQSAWVGRPANAYATIARLRFTGTRNLTCNFHKPRQKGTFLLCQQGDISTLP